MSKRVFWGLSLVIVVFLAACTSSGPATKYYSLFPAKEVPQTFAVANASGASLGVGPVILPDFVDHPSIVALTSSSEVKIHAYHAWAGDFKESIVRVMVADLSAFLQLDAVWGFPWDTRVRPKYQLRVVIEEMAGIPGEQVTLVMKWTLLNQKANTVLAMDKEKITAMSQSNSINAYVKALNESINTASANIAQKIAAELR